MSGKYAKFDSFLKRKLSNKEYKEVKIYEPCVVTSTREKHVFRFTFMTKDKVYITENPPKSLLYWIDFKYILDVFVVNDKAEFLQAQLRDSVQHVVVKYERNEEGNLRAVKSSNTTVLDDTNGSSTAAASKLFSGRFSFSSTKDDTSTTSGVSWMNTSVASQDSNSSGNSSSQNGVTQNRWALVKQVMKEEPKRLGVSVQWAQEDPYLIQVLATKDGSVVSEELHLYILNEDTNFLLMLKAAWKNWIICYSTATLQDKGHTEGHSTLRSDDAASPDGSVTKDDNTRMLFAGLKEELQLAVDVEHLYGLFHELKVGATQDVLVKSLFWRDDVLLKRSIDLTNNYIWESVSADLEQRADEIEIVILILQTVAVMLRDTEAIPQCYKVLRNISLAFFKKLIGVLLHPPKLPSPQWEEDPCIQALNLELSVASAEVLYELFSATQQITWVIEGKSTVFSSTVLFNVIAESDGLFPFLDRLMSAIKATWDSGKEISNAASGALDQESSVQAYRLFTVLHRIISRLSVAAQYTKENFKEEFKYYIHPGSVAKKFPPQYAISGMGRAVVHSVGSSISSN